VKSISQCFQFVMQRIDMDLLLAHHSLQFADGFLPVLNGMLRLGLPLR